MTLETLTSTAISYEEVLNHHVPKQTCYVQVYTQLRSVSTNVTSSSCKCSLLLPQFANAFYFQASGLHLQCSIKLLCPVTNKVYCSNFHNYKYIIKYTFLIFTHKSNVLITTCLYIKMFYIIHIHIHV